MQKGIAVLNRAGQDSGHIVCSGAKVKTFHTNKHQHYSHTQITITRKGAQHTRTGKEPSVEENITQGMTINAPQLL